MSPIIILLIYLLFPILIIIFFKYKVVQKIGTVIIAYAIGILLSLFNLVPTGDTADAQTMATIQKWVMNLTVPLAIPLMLFNSDFKLWTKSLPKTVAVIVGGIVSILIAVVLGFFVFRNSGIEDLTNVAAMMTGIYTGGTMNFYALGAALQVDPNTIVIAYTFEMLVTFPFILFLVAGGYKFFRWILPYKEDDAVMELKDEKGSVENSVEDYSGMLCRKNFPKMMLGFLLSVGMLIVGAGLSFLISGKLNEMIIILTITTLAIIASFSKKIRQLPKTFELGMFFILIFSIAVASQFSINSIDTNSLNICYFILFILVVSVILHVIISRIFKVSGDLFTVGHVGLLCSPPFIPPIVGAIGNRKVLISGIVIGLVGYAVGTYLGVMLSVVLSLF